MRTKAVGSSIPARDVSNGMHKRGNAQSKGKGDVGNLGLGAARVWVERANDR